MASISSLTGSSSVSSIYGNSNIISGLASGMDTEAMIENAVSGIQAKIAGLQQDRTKLEWEQESYRSITDKLTNFSSKFMDILSNTNLTSSVFFKNATTVAANGEYANKISATGESASSIQITKASLATTATFSGIGFDMSKLASGLDTKMTDLSAALGLAEGESVVGKTLTIQNGSEKADTITIEEGDTIKSVLEKISKSDAGVEAGFSETTGQFYIKSKTTGTGKLDLSGDLAASMFNAGAGTYVDGKKASVSMVVNGVATTKEYDKNQFTVDGMTINLKGSFEVQAGEEAVSFTTSVDADKVVDAVKSMIADFNAMANEVKDAYSTMPLYTSKGKRYEPLTEKDQEDMSEAAIKKHEEKAKTGLLFGDSTLSSLYNDLRDVMNQLGSTGIGITTEYSNGKTTLVLDESKLRSTLAATPEKVTEAFTAEKQYGAEKDSALVRLKSTVDRYTKSGTGILVNLVGSSKSPSSLNNNVYKQKITRLDETIQRWQDKLADKIDYYTKQFTRLEQLISDMNSQSSSLAGLMGY